MALTRGDRCVHAARAVARAETGSGGEPQPDRRRRQPQRVLHQRARSLPAARAAGGVHPVWARGGHVTGTWPRLYFVKHVLLICVFTEQTLFGWLKRTRGPILQDGFRAKTKRFPTYQDLAAPCFFLYLLGSFEVTVTSVSLPPFVSRRGLSNTNQRLSTL